ncbi:acylpyruvate hydrolase [Paragonimus westermani]|uniref:oxaloacetate tautomerase n=1 Tax=Paragonimus westermani TaxID=34504 RepID=A0A5J4NJ96_9TREM|nr:acylpyruvate hydrolase [Paragonimus westermani]
MSLKLAYKAQLLERIVREKVLLKAAKTTSISPDSTRDVNVSWASHVPTRLSLKRTLLKASSDPPLLLFCVPHSLDNKCKTTLSRFLDYGIPVLHHPLLQALIAFTDSILGFVVALDMTDRYLQNALKSRQLPWTLSKCFDTSCPVGPLLPCSMLPSGIFSPNSPDFKAVAPSVQLWLRVNQTERQRAGIDGMIHSPAELISFISYHMRLEPGDLILTGTPAGVGPVKSGDLITAGIEGICEVDFHVA